jgi:hypothetical protein
MKSLVTVTLGGANAEKMQEASTTKATKSSIAKLFTLFVILLVSLYSPQRARLWVRCGIFQLSAGTAADYFV